MFLIEGGHFIFPCNFHDFIKEIMLRISKINSMKFEKKK